MGSVTNCEVTSVEGLQQIVARGDYLRVHRWGRDCMVAGYISSGCEAPDTTELGRHRRRLPLLVVVRARCLTFLTGAKSGKQFSLFRGRPVQAIKYDVSWRDRIWDT